MTYLLLYGLQVLATVQTLLCLPLIRSRTGLGRCTGRAICLAAAVESAGLGLLWLAVGRLPEERMALLAVAAFLTPLLVALIQGWVRRTKPSIL
ncbi:MAG: hypothetical protein ACOY94_20090 [Bacillota bacterium]